MNDAKSLTNTELNLCSKYFKYKKDHPKICPYKHRDHFQEQITYFVYTCELHFVKNSHKKVNAGWNDQDKCDRVHEYLNPVAVYFSRVSWWCRNLDRYVCKTFWPMGHNKFQLTQNCDCAEICNQHATSNGSHPHGLSSKEKVFVCLLLCNESIVDSDENREQKRSNDHTVWKGMIAVLV